MPNHQRSGQIGLVVLLLMATILTVGIGAVSRSTSDLRVTRQETEANKAYQAAEAGVEEALFEITKGRAGEHTNGSDISVNDENISGEFRIQQLNEIDMVVSNNQVVTVDVQGANTGNQLDIDWISDADCPSLVIKTYNQTNNNVRTNGFAGDCDQTDHGINGFIPATSQAITYPLVSGDIMVRIRPVNEDGLFDTQIRVSGNGWTPPVQTYRIVSTASNNDSNETKVIQLDRTKDALPAIFDFAIFSGQDITS